MPYILATVVALLIAVPLAHLDRLWIKRIGDAFADRSVAATIAKQYYSRGEHRQFRFLKWSDVGLTPKATKNLRWEYVDAVAEDLEPIVETIALVLFVVIQFFIVICAFGTVMTVLTS